MNLDQAYEIGAFVPDGPTYSEGWEADATAFRTREAAIGRARLNVPYGDGARQALDIFHPAGKAEGLAVFVHGGYWQRFDRSYWSHFAAGLTARDWAVAMPSYTLAPEARVSRITAEVRQAIEVAASFVTGPIRVTGHSAGGHLAARMGCRDVALSAGVRDRLARLLPISPVSDLRPLRDIAMNDVLRLDPAEADAESPMLHAAPEVPVTVWVGAEERPVFLDQARWLAEAWDAEHRIAPGRHHFDVIDELLDPDSPLVTAFLS